MRCQDCRHKCRRQDGAAVTWTCGQEQSPRYGQIVRPYSGDYGTGCYWRDQEDVLPPLYHIATEDTVDTIRHQGLVPDIGPRSREAGEEDPAVYFFRSPEDAENAMLNWLGESLPEEGKAYMITAVLPRSYEALLRSDAPYEAACPVPVPPDYLDFQDYDEWYAWYEKGGIPAHASAD